MAKKERGNWISAQPATEPVPSCYARTARSCQWRLLVSNQQLWFFYWCHQPAADGSSSSLCVWTLLQSLYSFPDYEPPLLELLGYCLPSSPSEPCIDLRLLRKASSHFFALLGTCVRYNRVTFGMRTNNQHSVLEDEINTRTK